MEITLMNWDDIVRSEKAKAHKFKESKLESITWGTHGWDIYNQFKPKSREGSTYFGIKHYHDPAIKGYTVES